MTNTTNRALDVLSGDQFEALKKAMDDREIFDSVDAAIAKFEAAGAATTIGEGDDSLPFFGLPFAIVGQKEDGSIDESVYAGSRVALAYVGAKLDKATGAKGIVIYPVPTLETLLESETGKSFLDKLVVKECSHVGFRNVRAAATLYDFEQGVNAWPTSAEDYATESRRGIDTETFDTIWTSFRTSLKAARPALHELLPVKAEFLKALRSKAYAESNDNTKPLEEAGLFESLGKVLIRAASDWKDKDGKASPLDTSTIEAWLAGRDSFVLEIEAPKAKDFSILESMDLDF